MSLPTFSHPSTDQADLLSSWDLACSGWYGCRPQFNSKWSATLLFSPLLISTYILYFATMMIRLFNFLAASSVERCYSIHFFPQAILPDHELWPLNFYLTVAKGVEVPGHSSPFCLYSPPLNRSSSCFWVRVPSVDSSADSPTLF